MKVKITQEMKLRLSLIKYTKKFGVTKAAIRYKTNRQYIYRWLHRYDGDIRSLVNKSTRPKSHPKAHTFSEIKLIKDMRRCNPDTGLVVFWVKLKQRGYNHQASVLYRQMKKLGMFDNKPKKKSKKKTKPYIQMTYPGERIQIDIKCVPNECIAGEFKLYQYTAIDEYSRVRFLQIYDEKSTYISVQFFKEVINNFNFKIVTVRTDNGLEFTNRLISPDKLSYFEIYLKEHHINHDLIQPYTPKHNGKVERSHRKDSERFYRNRMFYSLEDAKKQLKYYLKEYNSFPMAPLGWKSPNEYLSDYNNHNISH
jgi:transposase InsO family protein